MTIIGLDVGTTAVKAVAFHGVTRAAIREYSLHSPQAGWQVQDPDVIVAATLDALAEVHGPDVAGVSVSAAMHGLIGLDSQNRPLTSLITWADGRAREQAAALRSTELYDISGVPVHPMSPLTKLRWFTEESPDIARRVRWWVGLKDYVLLALTGQLVTELSSASGTGLLDRRTRQWSPSAVRAAGISQEQLPPILSPTATLPMIAPVPGLPVVVGAADGPLGNVGTGALWPGSVALSVGTSAAARMVVPESTIDPGQRLFCYALTEDQWVVGSALSTGGAVVRWAGQVYGANSDEQVLQWASEAPPGCDGLIALPYLFAERGPLWDPTLAGAFMGIRAEHTRAHFCRAAIEGVARQLAVVVAALNEITHVRDVRATGGVFRSLLWREIVAGTLDRPLQVVDGAEGTARGAAALGLYALGICDDLASAVAQLQPSALCVTQPADAAAYRAVTEAIPALIRSYGGVAELFDPIG